MEYNKYIDHTLLKQDSTQNDVDKLIKEAIEHQFFSICINPTWVSYAKDKLVGSGVKLCVVLGFPLGASTTKTKVFEAKNLIELGVDEIDMVINIGFLKDQKDDYVLEEINAIKAVMGDKVLKVIIETCLLTKEEIIKASEIVAKSDADFIKTSTGFSTAGATFENVQIMLDVVADKALVKAAGGVRSFEDLQKYINMGVKRIGTSSGVKLLQNQKITSNNY